MQDPPTTTTAVAEQTNPPTSPKTKDATEAIGLAVKPSSDEQDDIALLRQLHREINGLTRRTTSKTAHDPSRPRKRSKPVDNPRASKHPERTLSEAGSASDGDAPAPMQPKASVTSDDRSCAQHQQHGLHLDPAFAEASASAAELARHKAVDVPRERPKCFVAGNLWGMHLTPSALASKSALADAVRSMCPSMEATSQLHVVLVTCGGGTRECPADCETCSKPGAQWACIADAKDVARVYVNVQ